MTQQAEPRVVSHFNAETTAQEAIAGLDLTGRNAIVTGGASGIGSETARVIAGAGARVLIAARNIANGQTVADRINAEGGHDRVTVAHLELDDLASVRAVATAWGNRPLALLINNAGIMACPEGRTRDGFETQFGTNHLGHFLLGVLLTAALRKGAPARLINLSSAGHLIAGIDFDDPNFERRPYEPFKAYGQSKTANALFAVEFDRRNRDFGVRAFSIMPGVIVTNLGRHMTPELRAKMGFVRQDEDGAPVTRYKSVEAGAATSVWAATAPELSQYGGLYLEDCAQALPFSPDLPRGKGVMPHALDRDAARQLWELSERLVGLA